MAVEGGKEEKGTDRPKFSPIPRCFASGEAQLWFII